MNLQLPYCFCFFLLLQLPFSTNGQAYKNVSLGSSLTAASGDLPYLGGSGAAYGAMLDTGNFMLAQYKPANHRLRWSFLAICLSEECFQWRKVGYGLDDFGNSYCELGDDQRPSCRCPPGYTFFDQDDERKGCKQIFISQDCGHPSPETDSFEIRDLLNTNFPYADYEYFGSVTEDWCRQACLSDCNCAVATFNDGEWLKKRGPLTNGVTDPTIGDKALMKLPFSTNGQAYKNVSLGSSLTAASGDLPWTSPSGDFAFGFQQVSDAGYLLSIWFNKIPERTIVWSANRNNLAQSGSTVQLTADGQLVLNDQSGTRIRNTAYLGGSGTAYGAMLDTGNFVLAGQAGDTLWQSFDQPTDSLLPTQNLKLGAQLIAPYLEKNYSDGRFKLILEDDGNLVMRTTAYPLTTSNFAYWSAGSSLGSGNQLTGSGNQLIFNQSGYMYVVASNGTILSHVFSNPVPLQDLYLRATIDYDGVFRQYVYPKTASGGKRWAMASTTLQTSIPPNICLAIRYSAGSGACGFNSYCTLGDDQRPSCRCPHGYTFSDKDDERKGCKKTFISQDCDHPSQEIDSFEIRVLLNTNFPFADYEFFGSVSEDWCRQSCLSDCYCDVATFNKVGQCWKKRGPLLNGVTDPSIGDKALMKVGKGNRTEELAQKKCAKKSNGSALIISGSVILGSSIFLIVLYVFFTNRKKQKMIPQHHVMRDMNLQNFTYNELETATGGFDEELGRGAFGPVYKGVLGGEDKQMIAVKRHHVLDFAREGLRHMLSFFLFFSMFASSK
ncbi:hypothetical protein OIU77_026396 [Salix suchowensis]|uniref:Bulb-type lectin domain-containing protein n=1 Tax=Salix suchowensis TaxID=1278906 RepID=A0ABQ9BL56_9ROSI|nr:hypothetical protein OIU77_026396 [Salix suchowensis]